MFTAELISRILEQITKLFSSLYVFLSDGILYLVTTDGLDFDINQRSISSPYNVRIQSIDQFKID